MSKECNSDKFLSASQKDLWDKASFEKNFHDTFYLAHFGPLVRLDEKVVEFGCGYGRILQYLQEAGYKDLTGYDFSPQMLARGKRVYPKLDLRLVEKPLDFPLEDASTDAVILSTVLCCIPDIAHQKTLLRNVERILKPGGVVYMSDFLISTDKKVLEKYEKGYREFSDYGVYQTSDNMIVRHHESAYVRILMKNFLELWWYEEASETMNGTPVHAFHSMFQKT